LLGKQYPPSPLTLAFLQFQVFLFNWDCSTAHATIRAKIRILAAPNRIIFLSVGIESVPHLNSFFKRVNMLRVISETFIFINYFVNQYSR